MAEKSTKTTISEVPKPNDNQLKNDPDAYMNKIKKSEIEQQEESRNKKLQEAKSDNPIENYKKKLGDNVYKVVVTISRSGEITTHSFFCTEIAAMAYKRKMERVQSRRKRIISVEKVK